MNRLPENPTIFKTALTAVLIVIVGMMTTQARPAKPQPKNSKTNQSMATLDFNYPKQACNLAEKELEKALKSGQPVEAIQALMAITVARDLVSHENVTSQIALIDSVAHTLGAPYESVALLLEACVYSDIMNRQARRAVKRVEAESMSQENPEFWDSETFKKTISSLLKKALELSGDAKSVSLTDAKSIVKISTPNATYPYTYSDFTLYDFIIFKTIHLLYGIKSPAVIPFFPSQADPTLNVPSLCDELLASHQEPSYGKVFAILMKCVILPSEDMKDYLWGWIEKTGNSIFNVPLVAGYYDLYVSDNEDAKKTFYSFVSSLYNKLGESPQTKPLKAILEKLALQKVSINTRQALISGQPKKVYVSSRNVNDINILIYKANSQDENKIKIKDLDFKCQLVKAMPLKFAGNVPFEANDSIEITIDAPGKYFVVFSNTHKASGSICGSDEHPSSFIVNDIDAISMSDRKEGKAGIYVLKSEDSSPLASVPVTFNENTGYYHRNDAKKIIINTDKDGYAQSPFENASATVSYNGSNRQVSLNTYKTEELKPNEEATILTDLAVYHPGDTVQFCGILFCDGEREAKLRKGMDVKVILRNANYEEVDTLEMTTDASGRFVGKFAIPKQGLLGHWMLEVEHWGSQVIRVEEYKLPSFFITLEKKETEPGKIQFEGFARTYSGMPLPGINVDYKINYSPLWRKWNYMLADSYDGNVTTDAEGRFVVELPINNLPKDYYYGLFSIRATATDQAGETMESPRRVFFINEEFSISPSFNSPIEIKEKDLTLNVRVTNQANLPVERTVRYEMKDEAGTLVKEGSFTSPTLTLDTSLIKSGKYSLSFRLGEDQAEDEVTSLILYRNDDKVPPMETPLWVPQKDITVPAGQNTVKVKYGCSWPGRYILCMISDSEGNVRKEWIRTDGLMHSLDISAPKANDRTYIKFATFCNHQYHEQTVTLIPEKQKEKCDIKVETFRDALSAGDTEHWRFRITKGGIPTQGYAVAGMYDKALNAIYPLFWSMPQFKPVFHVYYTLNAYNTQGFNASAQSLSDTGYPREFSLDFSFNTWGYSLYGSNPRRGQVYSKHAATSAKSSRSSVNSVDGNIYFADDMAEDVVAMADFNEKVEAPAAMKVRATAGAEVAEEGSDAGGNVEEGEENYRLAEMPLAFFMPDLSSDKEGMIAVDFTVPDFNTTWNFILGAYTPDMMSAVTRLETVVSKKVMVKMLYPRFIRTGDSIVLTSTLYNNSETELPIAGKIEVFDPITGEILGRIDAKAENVRPSGNRVISIEFDCPATINALGMRAYAVAGSHSDGEQTVIPVLPSSQPVIESTTFFASPAQRSVEVNLPEYPSDARLTLTYCENPLWETLTALSPVTTPESETLIPNVYALYANSVGYGILKNNPSLREGLQMIVAGEAGDSLLVSNLEKNQDLKTVMLTNTPWVNDARSETLRMSKLGSLISDEEARRAIETNWQRIMKLRNPDGGWSWFDGCRSSSWMTSSVLINLGLLRQAGYADGLPQLNNAVAGGVKFCDQEILADYSKYKVKKEYPYASLMQYLFIRSFFPEVKTDPGFASIKKKSLEAIESGWKSSSIFDKATIAILLWREGRRKTAADIIESLRQFASYTPEKGMWFDNLDSSWGGANKMLTTARVLMAFHTVMPEDEAVDRLRQWILLQRQTQDFQEGLFSIDAIDAILTTGNRWDGRYGKPQIAVGNCAVPLDRIAELTGSCTVDIDLNDASGKTLSISREAESPAWGGVISQYVAPMTAIKAAEIPQLKIEKRYWKIETQTDGSVKAVEDSTLHVGDKVRIALIVTVDRDMDFVALTDERSSCLEPLDRLSGYTSIDGVWGYKEIRNSATNIFFPFLSKGRHVFYYECSVQEAGEFSAGIATLQCLYAPVMTAHSAGAILNVIPKP